MPEELREEAAREVFEQPDLWGRTYCKEGRIQGQDRSAAHPRVSPRWAAQAFAAGAAERDVGVYTLAPYRLAGPVDAGLIFGYSGLSEAAIETGIRRLPDRDA